MKVSILIPCYNAEQWIGDAIESALRHTHPDLEVIVVDDGSTDASSRTIREFGSRVRHEFAPHRGGNATRNRLLELANGEWLQYLDADDYLLPTKIEDQLSATQKRGRVDVIFSPVRYETWERGQVITQRTGEIAPPLDPWVLLIRWRLPQTGAALWRRRTLRDLGGWKAEQQRCQEHELYLRLLMANKEFLYCEKGGAVYRQWSSETVCRKDPRATVLTRLEIVAAAENHLFLTGQLTDERSAHIAWARMECARSLFALDPCVARPVAEIAAKTTRSFPLPREAAFPPAYRIAYRWLGFAWAERLASTSRRLRQSIRPLLRGFSWPGAADRARELAA
jgi:glycosyltransferase involved in cell wall biosynthesis